MEQAVIDRLIREFESTVATHDQPFDGSGDWRLRVNAASTRMIVISREIAAAGAPAVAAFARLISSASPHVSLFAAHHLIDFMTPEPGDRDAAMRVIEQAASGSTAEAAAERLWMESMRAEGQDE